MEDTGLCPSVTIIVPVSGAAEELPLLLDSIQRTSYPPERREVVVVDNGLSSTARASLARRPVTVLEEPSKGSPGFARNAGARAATGEIIVIVDSDCVVEEQWLHEGVQALRERNAGVAAGRIVFRLSPERTAAEIFDSLVHMRNDILMARKGVVVTANLFVRRQAFLATGGFPSGFGGEDFIWARTPVNRDSSLSMLQRQSPCTLPEGSNRFLTRHTASDLTPFCNFERIVFQDRT